MPGALALTSSWPVPNVAAAIVDPTGAVTTVGDVDRPFRLASVTKVLTGWAAMVAVEEGIVALTDPVGREGCTLEHLLAHAGGYPFNGAKPIARVGARRIYSNTGIELAAEAIGAAAEMPFADYLAEAVLEPLGMRSSELRASPAFGLYSTVADVVAFIAELRRPRLISPATAHTATTVHFPTLSGQIPGLGRFSPCPWGLGCEIRGDKQPHWTGTTNSPATYGHFGGAGTILWVDPRAAVAAVALTDRRFDDWAADAVRLWSEFSDAALAEAAA
jgi:CubicO group peptidase (beta-lactamase class C family)